MKNRRETSVEYGTPHRHFVLRAINGAGAIAEKAGLSPSLDMNDLLHRAAHLERCDDFGDDRFREPLRILLDAVEREADLHFVGRFITRQRLLNLLRNRLRISALLRAHPEILDVPLPKVILITGLQRTGTTMLHRLLSEDPEHRALRSWEALNPAPIHRDAAADVHAKQKIARQAEKALAFLSPDFFAIHPVEAESSEEDVLLLDYALISTVAESTLRVPSYATWVEENDNRPAYAYMRTLLKVLSWKTKARTWILKSPHHLEFLDEFLELFPGATVVMTHRDPAQTLPSFCSMMWHGRGIFSDRVDAGEVGQHWLRKTSRMLQIGFKARERRADTVFVDVQYRDLIADPISQIRRIYLAAGRELSSEALAKMETARGRNVQHRYGVHRYALEPFGLSVPIIHANYGDYVAKYCEGVTE